MSMVSAVGGGKAKPESFLVDWGGKEKQTPAYSITNSKAIWQSIAARANNIK
jgi:hypothetical protein